jgi:transglutaminase-like putative cysteine protease
VRFRLVHKLATFLLASTAIFTLATSGMLSTPTLVLVVAALVLAWQADPDSRIGQWFDRRTVVLNVLTLLLLAVAVFQVARSFPDLDLSPFLDFVLFLLALKMCQRRAGRDYLQIFILTFLIMLAAAWMATSVVFMVGFGVYGMLATWALVLFHLRREIEENYIVRHSSESRTEQVTATRVLNSRRVVGLSFFVATGSVALLVLLGSSLVFAMVPRVGLGFILGGVRRQVGIAGFTDQVKLGMHGSISPDNQTVVLRAQIPSITALGDDKVRERVIASLYWRGTVYDTYDKGEWLRSRDDSMRTLFTISDSSADLSRSYLLVDPSAVPPAFGRKAAQKDAIAQTIEIVALSHPVAFAVDHPVLFEIPQPATGSFTAIDLEPRWADETSLRAYRVNPANPYDRRQSLGEFLGATYRAYSRDASRARPSSVAATELPPTARARYLHVPDSLTPRVRALANEIVAAQGSPTAKVQAVVAWLGRTHGYTTNLRRDERIADPVEDFLFEEKAGHCEYFASSAAILLRLGGVPTRYINGFLGGEWNNMRQSVTVRENRAHSWVEAYLGSEGWVRVDATPALGRTSRMGALSQLFDSAEQFWGRWVVEYSASQQLLLAQRVGRHLGFASRDYHPGPTHAPITKRQALFLAAGVFIVFALASQRRRLLRWRAPRPRAVLRRHSESPIVRMYRTTIDRLASAGLGRQPSETPHEYLRRMVDARIEGAPVLAQLTDLYTSAYYGAVPIPPEEVARMRGESRRIDVAP